MNNIPNGNHGNHGNHGNAPPPPLQALSPIYQHTSVSYTSFIFARKFLLVTLVNFLIFGNSSIFLLSRYGRRIDDHIEVFYLSFYLF